MHPLIVMTRKPSLPRLSYCAFKYLGQWIQYEDALHQSFKKAASPQMFREALQYFQISRSFEGIAVPKRLDAARRLYLTAAVTSRQSPEHRVEALAAAFEKRFGKYNVSAASKLLWLKYREPFVVMDSRAVKALKWLTGKRFASNDYAAYAAVWRDHYAAERVRIRAAAMLVPSAAAFLPTNRLSKSELAAICSAEWFRERVLDIFLREVGGDV